jgi:hypothetical protein
MLLMLVEVEVLVGVLLQLFKVMELLHTVEQMVRLPLA